MCGLELPLYAASSVCGLKPLVYVALCYSVCGLKLLVSAVLSYIKLEETSGRYETLSCLKLLYEALSFLGLQETSGLKVLEYAAFSS